MKSNIKILDACCGSRSDQPKTIRMCGLEWMTENLSGFGGTEIDGRWYYTWYEAMKAAKQLGNGWRLPTSKEFEALCKAKITRDDERKGCLFAGKLFLPTSGYREYPYGSVPFVGFSGWYWSSSPCSRGGRFAQYLYFYAGGVDTEFCTYRMHGFSVRCVRDIK